MPFVPAARNCTLHHFTPRLIAIEHNHLDANKPPQNLLIFIGGLGDGLMTVPYSSILAEALPETWSLAQTLLSSSYQGWGISTLSSDVVEIAQCVKYFRTIKRGKIVLLGHSTGCQDVMEYLVGPGCEDRPRIDGAIIQASISDREAILTQASHDEYSKSVAIAQAMFDDGKPDEIVPADATQVIFGGTPVTARRWLSLLSPNHDGEDDYFSSDLSDGQLNRTFGRLPAYTAFCILYSGADQYVPPEIDKRSLVTKWIKIAQKHGRVDTENSGIIQRRNTYFDRRFSRHYCRFCAKGPRVPEQLAILSLFMRAATRNQSVFAFHLNWRL